MTCSGVCPYRFIMNLLARFTVTFTPNPDPQAELVCWVSVRMTWRRSASVLEFARAFQDGELLAEREVLSRELCSVTQDPADEQQEDAKRPHSTASKNFGNGSETIAEAWESSIRKFFVYNAYGMNTRNKGARCSLCLYGPLSHGFLIYHISNRHRTLMIRSILTRTTSVAANRLNDQDLGTLTKPDRRPQPARRFSATGTRRATRVIGA